MMWDDVFNSLWDEIMKERTKKDMKLEYKFYEKNLAPKWLEGDYDLHIEGNRMTMTSKDGKNTSAMLKVCARKAGIENWEELHISNHTMRRTFATMMSEADVPIEVISKAMGHSGIQITSRYVKRTEQRAVNAMSVVNF